ncbi:MAG: carboxyltransferase [Actinobacteria bacterium]|nr:carboxyltransferase [Actinomycetota bacterium]
MKVEFVDQTLRDGQQSLWGLRLRAFEALEALPHLDATGFRVIDLTGAGMFTVLLRTFKDDPWESTDLLVAGLPNNKLRAATRTISVGGMGFTPDSVVDLWVNTMAKHGIGSFWIFDCLFDMPKFKRVVDVVKEAGADPAPAVMYGLTDVHTDEWFAARAAEIDSWDIPSIYVEDAPGVLTPERAATLLPALQKATPKTPLELHCHATTGLAQLVYLEGLKAGIDILHTCSLPMANGPSLPSTEAMLASLRVLGHEHDLDESQLPPVAAHFERAALTHGAEYELGVPNEFSLLPYEHQLPGGMTGSLKKNLADHGMEDQLTAVLEEIPAVRRDLGEPIMATPFSQFVGIQALLNIVSGERYKVIPDEVIQYTLGHYGPLARDVEPDVKDRILASPNAAKFEGWEQPQPSLADLRKKFGKSIRDEELLLRALYSEDEVDAMIAAGPVPRDPRTSASEIVENVRRLVADRRDSRAVSIFQPGFSIELRRGNSEDETPA